MENPFSRRNDPHGMRLAAASVVIVLVFFVIGVANTYHLIKF